MATVTKKELIDRIADSAGHRRVQVKRVIQQFLDEIVAELGKGNRLEFRDFGVFETKVRKARKAQNPKTLEPVEVPERRTVKLFANDAVGLVLGLQPRGEPLHCPRQLDPIHCAHPSPPTAERQCR